MDNNILIPYVKGLAEAACEQMHMEALQTGTPSVEPDVGIFLSFTAKLLNPSSILELGCGIGVSTRYMAKSAPEADITAVDMNRDRLRHAEEAAGKFPNIRFVCADAVKYLKEDTGTYDMIFVDSMKRDYPMVFHCCYEKLNPGGVIIMDDVFAYGQIFLQDCEIPPKYINLVRILREFLNNIKHTYTHTLLPIGGGVLLVRRESGKD